MAMRVLAARLSRARSLPRAGLMLGGGLAAGMFLKPATCDTTTTTTTTTTITTTTTKPAIPEVKEPAAPEILTLASITTDDPNDPPKKGGRRKWVPKCPDKLRAEATRPLTEAELDNAKARCHVTESSPVPGRAPKIVITYGAAGTGKSFKMPEAYKKFGVTDPDNVVQCDGDEVRQCHEGLRRVCNIDVATFLSELEGAEKAQYVEMLADIAGDAQVAFMDNATWVYEAGGPIKTQFLKEAVSQKKDILIAMTALKSKYAGLIEKAVSQQGYQVYMAGFVVKPKVLVTRQMGRARVTGRTVRIANEDLALNAKAQQEAAIKGLSKLAEMCEQTKGYWIVYNNSPDYRFPDTDPPVDPIFERDASADITKANFQGFDAPKDINGVLAYLKSEIQPN